MNHDATLEPDADGLPSGTILELRLWRVEEVRPYTNNPRQNADAVDSVAESIRLFGFNQPIAVDEEGVVLAGHTRLEAAKQLGMGRVPVVVRGGLTESEKKAYRIRDNRSAELSEWDTPKLAFEFSALNLDGFDATLTGFSSDEIGRVLDGEDGGTGAGAGGSDEIPDEDEVPATTRLGDLYRLGKHRLLCGDALRLGALETLIGHAVEGPAACLHADPPYGMGKEADGVANDNPYGDKLDAFQLEWLRLWIPKLSPAASVYVWGNAPDLWRLWYREDGLAKLDRLTVRNEIVWDKGGIAGMASPELTQYPEASERCLFLQRGTTYLGNVNKDDFFEPWEPIRAYLETEAVGAELTPAKLFAVCGVKMFGHWFRRSQFSLIPEKHYATLAATYPGYFEEPWANLRRQFEAAEVEKRAARPFFDNAHAVMRDVWDFARVVGDDRHGHATPKPLELMQRIVRSSVPEGGLVLEPFLGSGSTLIAAETTGRVCYGTEIDPRHCDVIVRRWETVTGLRARRIPFGEQDTRDDDPGTA